MKYSLGISNFLEEISSLYHSVVFLYFFSLITEEGFLISSCYSLELCIKWVYIAFSPLPIASLLFPAICKASLDSHFGFLHFFRWGWSWSLPPVQCHIPPSIDLQALCLSDLNPWIYSHFHCIIVRDSPWSLKCPGSGPGMWVVQRMVISIPEESQAMMEPRTRDFRKLKGTVAH